MQAVTATVMTQQYLPTMKRHYDNEAAMTLLISAPAQGNTVLATEQP
jgi:hypothetical protein